MNINGLDIQFDLKFYAIENLYWLPWVGDSYTNCHDRDKILILGESCYDWGGKSAPERLKQRTFTREMAGISHGTNPKSKEKFFRNFERAILLNRTQSAEARDKFWRSICFHNPVLRSMSSYKERPCVDDYRKGWRVFFELIKITKPEICIFAGTDWNKLESFCEIVEENGSHIEKKMWRKKVGRARGTHLLVKTTCGHAFSILFIKHPSMSFSWEKWGAFIRDNVTLRFHPLD